MGGVGCVGLATGHSWRPPGGPQQRRQQQEPATSTELLQPAGRRAGRWRRVQPTQQAQAAHPAGGGLEGRPARCGGRSTRCRRPGWGCPQQTPRCGGAGGSAGGGGMGAGRSTAQGREGGAAWRQHRSAATAAGTAGAMPKQLWPGPRPRSPCRLPLCHLPQLLPSGQHLGSALEGEQQVGMVPPLLPGRLPSRLPAATTAGRGSAAVLHRPRGQQACGQARAGAVTAWTMQLPRSRAQRQRTRPEVAEQACIWIMDLRTVRNSLVCAWMRRAGKHGVPPRPGVRPACLAAAPR